MTLSLKQLLTMSQDDLLKQLPRLLKDYGYKDIVVTDFAIWAKPEQVAIKAQPCLVAHLDTINTHRGATPLASELCFDDHTNRVQLSNAARKDVACLGADDRVGVFTILETLDQGYRPNILFTTDEEIGCVGTCHLLQHTAFDDMYEAVSIFIQIDRGVHEGSYHEMVFYDYDPFAIDGFLDQLSKTYTMARGSFTDVTELGPHFDKPIVNLSASYQHEHTRQEVINMTAYATNRDALHAFLDWIDDQDTSDWYYTEDYMGDCLSRIDFPSDLLPEKVLESIMTDDNTLHKLAPFYFVYVGTDDKETVYQAIKDTMLSRHSVTMTDEDVDDALYELSVYNDFVFTTQSTDELVEAVSNLFLGLNICDLLEEDNCLGLIDKL